MSDRMISAVRRAALDRFVMERSGIHGLKHWERVRENGQAIAKRAGADELVVQLFAYLHDCCRESDGSDPEHGLRAARFAELLSGSLLKSLEPDRVFLLTYACEHHEKGRVSDNATIGSCWDSDRLDLGRVGIRPNRKFLSTDRAKSKSVLDWAYQRSRGKIAKLKG